MQTKYQKTSDPDCYSPHYHNYNRLPFSERHQLATLECAYLNTLPHLRKKQITVYLVVKHDTVNNYTEDKCIWYDFYGAGEFFRISYVSQVGVLPLVYGTSFE